MEINILKTVSNKCFTIINQAILCRNNEAVICNHGVIITLDDLGRDCVTVKLMDQVTGIMRSYGVKNARYQKDSRRFFGVVSLESAAISPGNIPLKELHVPITYSNVMVTKF